MTNILIFSLGGIFTGIIGAAFLSVARTLRKDTALRNHMIMAAYGFLLFYIAGSATAAQAAYPPPEIFRQGSEQYRQQFEW